MKLIFRQTIAIFFVYCIFFASMAMGAETKQYKIEVWADNWFSSYIDGKPLLEDSVSIRTERSFNAETHNFFASSSFVLAFIIKDFKQNDTGLEYIGTNRQQMGDGGFITQITDLKSKSIVAISDSAMRCKVIHKAPLDSKCVNSSNPIAGKDTCQFISESEPALWKSVNFDDSLWVSASEYKESQVRPKDGYDDINWDSKAKLIWTSDLEKDNTLLCRLVVDTKKMTTQNKTKHTHMHSHFKHFDHVKTSEDSEYLLVSSNGLPTHNMMLGITSWQQQVPIPQKYTGNNSWKIPLNPVLSDKPKLTKNHFHKGAIAIAVNGVPIFNALNNRGEYAVDIGELDSWGGHSGRADDYHYHVAPEHLEKVVGKGNPIGYALDGYPLYGKTTNTLDKYLGRFNKEGSYQYHASKNPPYLIAGLRGVVKTDSPAKAPEDQIEPQPRSYPVRTNDYGPLNDAKITDFKKVSQKSYSLEYTIGSKKSYVNYSWNKNSEYQFEYVDDDGKKTIETYDLNTKRDVKKQKVSSKNKQGRKYCGDGICDNTESKEQCLKDCMDK